MEEIGRYLRAVVSAKEGISWNANQKISGKKKGYLTGSRKRFEAVVQGRNHGKRKKRELPVAEKGSKTSRDVEGMPPSRKYERAMGGGAV